MRALIARFTAFYGSNPLHLLGTIAAFALAGYVVTLLGPQALWNPKVWWQSIAVWFLAAIIAHDLILFPLYALADRSVTAALAAVRGSTGRARSGGVAGVAAELSPCPDPGDGAVAAAVLSRNHPSRGNSSYLAATGQNQQPFFARWLLLVAALYGLSALAYAARLAVAGRRRDQTDPHIDADADNSSTQSQ